MKEYLKINKRNSIEYNEIKTNGFLINSKPHIPLDYLEVLDKIIMNY